MSTCTFPNATWNTFGNPHAWNGQSTVNPWFNTQQPQGWNPWTTPFGGFHNSQPFGGCPVMNGTSWNSGWNWNTPSFTNSFQNWNTPFGWNWNTPTVPNSNWTSPFHGFNVPNSFNTPGYFNSPFNSTFGWPSYQGFSTPFAGQHVGHQPNFFWQPYQGFNGGYNGQMPQSNIGINREAA